MQPPRRPIPTQELFAGFFMVGISGFGGVLPFIRRMIVDQRGWLTAAEFTDMLALCQFLPGPNVCNLAVTLGSRERGVRGALAAVLGIPAVAHALAGLASAAAGLVLATALRIAGPLWGRRLGMAVAAVSFVAIALLRLPLLPTLLLVVPASILLHARPGLR